MNRLVVAIVALGGSAAHAEDARALSASAAFTPGVLAADATTGYALASTQYDGSQHATELDAHAEVPIWDRVRAVVRVDDFASTNARPGAGLGVRLLDEPRYGVALAGYAVYKAEGFTEPDGELESTLAVGKRLGPIRTTLDLTYGQDFDGKERDGEVAAAALGEVALGWFVGATAHYRDALGSPGELGVLRDFIGGPTLTFDVRFLAITAVAGVAGVGTATGHAFGPTGTIAIGAAF